MSREMNPTVLPVEPSHAGVGAPAARDRHAGGEAGRPGRRGGTWVAVGAAGLLALAGGAAAMGWFTQSPRKADPSGEVAVLSVQTTVPKQILQVRTVEQPGTILPDAQVELYAKASGYLLSIRRETTPALAAALVGQPLLSSGLLGGPAGQAGWGAAFLRATMHQGPLIDIGSRVEAGDLLMEIDTPERREALAQAEAALDQRTEELAQARTAIETFQSAVTVAKARLAEAAADVQRYESAHVLRTKQLTRVKALVRQKAVEPGLEDEKEAEVAAARSAWDSSLAKQTAAEAEVQLARSKLASARGEVRVKEAYVRSAVSNLEQARILLKYSELHAPFAGTVTFRGVDEGDFVQNARTGQSRHLMTVTASDRVKVALQLPSREGVLARVGAKATVTVDSRPGEAFSGRVARARGQLDLQSRTMQVEIDLDNRSGRLVPGMYAHVRLTLSEKPGTWVVPATALFSRNKVNYLIVVRDGVARRQPVRIVFDGGGEMEVVKLAAGKEVSLDGTEELVVSGKGAIADGQRVRTVRQSGEIARTVGSH